VSEPPPASGERFVGAPTTSSDIAA